MSPRCPEGPRCWVRAPGEQRGLQGLQGHTWGFRGPPVLKQGWVAVGPKVSLVLQPGQDRAVLTRGWGCPARHSSRTPCVDGARPRARAWKMSGSVSRP